MTENSSTTSVTVFCTYPCASLSGLAIAPAARAAAHVHERLIIFTVPIVINDGKLVPFVVGRRHKRDPPKLLQRRVPPAHRHLEGECLSCKTQRARVVRLGQRVVLSSMSQEGGREGGRLTRRSGSHTLARL